MNLLFGQALGNQILPRITTQIENQQTQNSEHWNEYLYDVEQVCGWLLINSIDLVFWVQNKQTLEKSVKDGISKRLALDRRVFIEVIISHNLIQAAKYNTDTHGRIVPARDKNHNPMMFDAVSPGAPEC